MRWTLTEMLGNSSRLCVFVVGRALRRENAKSREVLVAARAVPCSSVVFIHTRPKLRGARGGSQFFSRCRGLLRAVENLIRVNSWKSWPKKAATNSTKNHHCPLDVIGLKCNFSQSLRPALIDSHVYLHTKLSF